jgi:hypothetical protein
VSPSLVRRLAFASCALDGQSGAFPRSWGGRRPPFRMSGRLTALSFCQPPLPLTFVFRSRPALPLRRAIQWTPAQITERSVASAGTGGRTGLMLRGFGRFALPRYPFQGRGCHRCFLFSPEAESQAANRRSEASVCAPRGCKARASELRPAGDAETLERRRIRGMPDTSP